MRLAFHTILVMLLLVGCAIGRGTGVFPPEADFHVQPSLSASDDNADHRILIANGLSETITLIERTSGSWNVTPDILETGQAPSQMVVRDRFCYLINSLSNSIQVIDLDAMTTVREISTGAGTNPLAMDFIDDTTAIVTCYLSNEVVLVDLDDDSPSEYRIIDRISLPEPDELPHDAGVTTNARPGGLAVVGETCYVACSNLETTHKAGGPGLIVEIDIESRSITRVLELNGRDTVGVIHSPRLPDRLVVISAGDYVIATGFIGNGTVESIDLNSGEIFQVIEIEGAPFGGVIGPDDILIMENGKEGVVLRVDLREGVELAGYPLPTLGEPLSYASSMLALPGLICVTDFNADRLYLLDPDAGEVLAELATGDGPDAIALVD